MFGSLITLAAGRLHQLAQFGQIVGLALCGGQLFGKGRDDPARQRDVLRADRNACGRRKVPG